MRMRQSLNELEAAFFEETAEDRERRERLRARAARRTRKRRTDKVRRRGTMRFVLLVLTLLGTAVIVAIAMFRTLYYVMG
jgi:hypothetical protein